MSPVKERPARNPRSLALALGGVLLGLVVLVVVFVVALPGLTEEGTVQVKLGADTFTVGQARPKAESIASDGPFLFSDVANGQRDIYVQHLGEDPLTGWSAFDARLPGAGRDCSLRWEQDQARFVDPCSGEVVPADGEGLAHYPVEVTGDETVVVDFNADRRASATTTTEAPEPTTSSSILVTGTIAPQPD
jgi:hypothetical protein